MNDWTALLEGLVKAKDELKRARDKEAALNKEVKHILDEQGIEKGIYNDIKVNYTDCTRTCMDEDKLLEILLDLQNKIPEVKDCLIPTYKIDEDKLESLIYEGLITPYDIDDAYYEVSTRRLTVSRVKKND